MSNNHKSIELPQNWGGDFLSSFQQTAFQNEISSFFYESKWVKIINDIANMLSHISQTVLHCINENNETPVLLTISSFNHYLAAARLTISGHCLPSYPIIRSSIEFSMYSWYLNNNPQAVAQWHNKPTEKKAMRKWSQKFSFTAINTTLSIKDSDFSRWAEYIYQTAIDFGGHPNKEALYSNIVIDGQVVSLNILHEINDTSLLNLKTTTETGLFLIKMNLMIFMNLLDASVIEPQLQEFTDRLAELQQTNGN